MLCFSSLFPDVVNCMQTDNLELKKLVYLYLMNYAKSQPDMAIMAVNTFVKVRITASPLPVGSTEWQKRNTSSISQNWIIRMLYLFVNAKTKVHADFFNNWIVEEAGTCISYNQIVRDNTSKYLWVEC